MREQGNDRARSERSPVVTAIHLLVFRLESGSERTAVATLGKHHDEIPFALAATLAAGPGTDSAASEVIVGTATMPVGHLFRSEGATRPLSPYPRHGRRITVRAEAPARDSPEEETRTNDECNGSTHDRLSLTVLVRGCQRKRFFGSPGPRTVRPHEPAGNDRPEVASSDALRLRFESGAKLISFSLVEFLECDAIEEFRRAGRPDDPGLGHEPEHALRVLRAQQRGQVQQEVGIHFQLPIGRDESSSRTDVPNEKRLFFRSDRLPRLGPETPGIDLVP